MRKFLKIALFLNIFVCVNLKRTERLIYKNPGFHKSENISKVNTKKFQTRDIGYKNYLNYRDVYGLRYSPVIISKKNTKPPIDNEIAQKTTNGSKVIEEHFSNSIESETISSETIANNIDSSTVQSVNFTLNNFIHEDVDDEDEIEIEVAHSHHIMKPNNRVEHALNFLANRMKNLLYYGNDPTRPESQIVAPHLLSLGKFLNVFSSLRFDNGPCIAGQRPMRQLSGSCLNEVECINFGGISMNRCANGLGVCCICKYLQLI